MVKVIAHTARQKTPRQIGQELPGLLEDYLLHSRSFERGLRQILRNTIQAQITAVVRSSSGGVNGSGSNQVQIKRTGAPNPETGVYTVWGTMYVPKVGDQIYAIKDGATLYVLAAAHGGRANEHTVMWSGGAIKKIDASGLTIQEVIDNHVEIMLGLDGVTTTHHRDQFGNTKHLGQQYGNATIDSSGNASGRYWRSYVSQGNAFSVALNTSVSSIIERLLLDHDGATHRTYSGGSYASIHNGTTLSVYLPNIIGSSVIGSQFGGPGGAGVNLQWKQSNSAGYHAGGDDGVSGHMTVQSYSTTLLQRTDNGTNQYQQTKDRTIFPSGARLKALTTDSSEIASLNPAESAGTIKTQSHSVNNGGATVSTGTITTGGQDLGWGGTGTGLSLHFKIVSAVVYDSSSSGVIYGLNYATQKNALGGFCYTGAGNPPAASTTAFWAVNFTNTNAGIQLHLQTTTGTYGSSGGTIAIQYQVVN